MRQKGVAYREIVDDPVVVILFVDDGLKRLHVMALEHFLAKDVAELVLLHEQLPEKKRMRRRMRCSPKFVFQDLTTILKKMCEG